MTTTVSGTVGQKTWSGRLDTRIERLSLKDNTFAFRKSGRTDGADDLRQELDALLWLEGRYAVPRVLNHSHDGKALHIVMTEIPGVPAHRVPADKRGQAVEAIACALQEMQRVTITKAPLKKSPAEDVPVIEELIEQGRLDTAGFAAAAGQSPQAVLEQLRQMLSTRPIGGADTLSHGDFCLPNILLGPSGAVTGVIDWGLARRASRFRDCVVLEGSLLRNYGSDYIDRFYDAYGARPDADERRLFRMIDLFFEYQRPETVRSRPQP